MKKIIILGFAVLSLLMVLLFTCSIFEGLDYDQWVAKYNITTTTTGVTTTTVVGATTTTVSGTTATTTTTTVGGTTTTTTTLAAGSLDKTFGVWGEVTTDISTGQEDYGYAAAIQPDGKIVVAGCSGNLTNYDFALARYKTDGTLDPSFGSTGKITTPIGSMIDYGCAVAIQSNGKIIVAGYFDNGPNKDFALARYKTDGTLDPSFGTGGKVATDISSGKDDYGRSIVIQSDGKIIVAGYCDNGSNKDFALARYEIDGTLDITFGTLGTGIVITDFGAGYDDYGNSVAIQSDGKIVVGGYTYDGSNFYFSLARYTTNGTLDASFGTLGTGIVITDFSAGYDDYGNSVAIQSDGKIIVVGRSYNGFDYDFALARYESNGTLDTNFGTGGKVTTDMSSGSNDYGNSIAIQPGGKIVVGGASSGDFALARYESNGTLDTNFGTGGKVTTDISSGSDDYGRSTVIQSDGKIIVVGRSKNGSNNDFALVRYNP